MLTEKHPESTIRVLKKHFNIISAFQESPDCYQLQLALFNKQFGSTETRVVNIKLNADQLTDYRKLQKETLKQTGALIFDQRVEADGVGKWPFFLAGYLGEVA